MEISLYKKTSQPGDIFAHALAGKAVLWQMVIT